MLSASEYFDGVRRAAIEVERCHRLIDELRSGTIPRTIAEGPHGKGDYSDPTADAFAAMVSMMDAAVKRRDACLCLIGESLAMIESLRKVFTRNADVLELYYIELRTWAEIAEDMHVADITVRRWRDELFEWLDQYPRSYVMACRFIEAYNI